jgi:pimeloyl-ACP methyl ester carboxylesterase
MWPRPPSPVPAGRHQLLPGRRPGQPLAQAQGLRRVDVPTLVIWGDQDRYPGRELAEPDPAWVPEVRVERIPRPATGSRPTPPNGSTS